MTQGGSHAAHVRAGKAGAKARWKGHKKKHPKKK